MKIKVSFLDKQLLKEYGIMVSWISVIASLIALFIELPENIRKIAGIIFVAGLLVLYLILWIDSNKLTQKELNINNSTVEIKVGNIFDEEGLKVIAFNEYYDTQVDDKIIANETLNGFFIIDKVTDIQDLDEKIANDEHLQEKIICREQTRRHGKTVKYELGTLFKYGEYLLAAFSHFDRDNRAYLTMPDYLNFLINFWNEVDRIYAGKSVVIPLLGSGITRFKGYDMISEQELLEVLIWSFKISRVKFTYPSKIIIVISEAKKDKINFYKLKED